MWSDYTTASASVTQGGLRDLSGSINQLIVSMVSAGQLVPVVLQAVVLLDIMKYSWSHLQLKCSIFSGILFRFFHQMFMNSFVHIILLYEIERWRSCPSHVMKCVDKFVYRVSMSSLAMPLYHEDWYCIFFHYGPFQQWGVLYVFVAFTFPLDFQGFIVSCLHTVGFVVVLFHVFAHSMYGKCHLQTGYSVYRLGQ